MTGSSSEPLSKKKCLGVDCENEAGSLQCPTCLKIGVTDSFFCSQDCFKKNWVRLCIPIERRTQTNKCPPNRRTNIKPYTRRRKASRKMVECTKDTPRKAVFLNPIQLPGSITLSRPILLPAPSGLSIHFLRDVPSLSRYRTLTMPNLAYREESNALIGPKSIFSTPKPRRRCARFVSWPAKYWTSLPRSLSRA